MRYSEHLFSGIRRFFKISYLCCILSSDVICCDRSHEIFLSPSLDKSTLYVKAAQEKQFSLIFSKKVASIWLSSLIYMEKSEGWKKLPTILS